MLISHKITLNPNNKHATYFSRAAGVARFAYNWGLNEWQKKYDAHKLDPTQPRPSQFLLRRELNAIKADQFPWMLEVTKNAPQMAIIQLGLAFKNFFQKRADYPTFRKKGIDDRFSLTNDQFKIDGSRIRIPKLGWVRMRETLRFAGKILSATISRRANRWYASIQVETPNNPHLTQAENQGVVGVDLGISALATFSTGEPAIVGPKAHSQALLRLKRLSRAVSRKEKGSNNCKKAKIKLSKLHAKIYHIRQNALHQLTTDLTRRFHTIGIEDLNVKGMIKNRHLSRAISDMGFFEFRRQLEYKAEWRGGIVVVADRFYASSKICSFCGYKNDALLLSQREWTCEDCHTTLDRDVNAAINLKNYAVSSTVKARGEEGSGHDVRIKVKPASVKQESNTKATFG